MLFFFSRFFSNSFHPSISLSLICFYCFTKHFISFKTGYEIKHIFLLMSYQKVKFPHLLSLDQTLMAFILKRIGTEKKSNLAKGNDVYVTQQLKLKNISMAILLRKLTQQNTLTSLFNQISNGINIPIT